MQTGVVHNTTRELLIQGHLFNLTLIQILSILFIFHSQPQFQKNHSKTYVSIYISKPSLTYVPLLIFQALKK